MDVSQDRAGITVKMMKKDRECGGLGVPVTFVSFNISGVRPVDVFNAMLDTQAEMKWNSECNSVTLIGEYPEQGARGWSVTFEFPLGGDRDFVQWQTADIDFEKEDFWLVYSTLNNDMLLRSHHLREGAVSAQNCLGAYHITKNPDGSTHVVMTQNVNVHIPLNFPVHLMLSLFPPAWKITIRFVQQLIDQSKLQASFGWDKTQTGAPAFMLQDPTDLRSPSSNMSFPKQRATEESNTLLYLQAILVCLMLCSCVICSRFCCRALPSKLYQLWLSFWITCEQRDLKCLAETWASRTSQTIDTDEEDTDDGSLLVVEEKEAAADAVWDEYAAPSRRRPIF
mmetsp:Transcript_4530/g.8285  ORF Transcript_4530/g.8285 Transcript_4530/m.8285 type:complete len:339 (-) Transcript_4530:41-1057(-)